jgi:hypothetical protein
MSLFLPFSAQARADEERAIEIKRDFDYGPYEAVDPWEFAERVGIDLVDGTWLLDQSPPHLRAHLLKTGPGRWSAGTLEVAGRSLTVLNPSHSPARQTATLVEELMHVVLGHPPSRLEVHDGLALRTCAHDVEDEAYRLGAAMVIPYRDLFNWINAGHPLHEFSAAALVSSEYLEFRVKRAGLWRLHQARRRHGQAVQAAP